MESPYWGTHHRDGGWKLVGATCFSFICVYLCAYLSLIKNILILLTVPFQRLRRYFGQMCITLELKEESLANPL